MENTNMAHTDDGNTFTADDARALILRRIKEDQRLTLSKLAEEVQTGQIKPDVATVLASTIGDMLRTGAIHSVGGRFGGLREGPEPERAAGKAGFLAAVNKARKNA